MKKVLRGIVTTTAVVALFVLTVYALFFVDITWFQDFTRWMFLHNLDWFASRNIDLADYRIISAGWFTVFSGIWAIYAVGQFSDLIDCIIGLLKSRKAA